MRNGKNSFVYLWQIQQKLFHWYVGEKHVESDKKQANKKENILIIVTFSIYTFSL